MEALPPVQTSSPQGEEALATVSALALRLAGVEGQPVTLEVEATSSGTPPWLLRFAFKSDSSKGLVVELFEAAAAGPAWFRAGPWAAGYRKLRDGRDPTTVPGYAELLTSFRRSIEKADQITSRDLGEAASRYARAGGRRRNTGTSGRKESDGAVTKSLLLNLTTFCNAKCPFCIVAESLNRPELNMTDEQIFGTIQKAREEGAWELGYSGGEPTVHPKILEIVAYARGLGYRHQSINTNGIKFRNAEFCRRMLEAGMTSIDISIHGHTDELHDQEVARPGALECIREACEHLRALRSEFDFHLSATTVVTRQNHAYLKDICVFLDALGIEHKRLKYAYEGHRTSAAVINEVAPYEQVAPSVQAALDYLATGHWGFEITHVPLCLLGDHAVFSSDYERREALMVGRYEAALGDPSHFMRRQADECSSCVLQNQCTRLDRSYEEHHGRPTLKPFASQADVEVMFERGRQRWPERIDLIDHARDYWVRHRDVADPASRRLLPPVIAQPHERASLKKNP